MKITITDGNNVCNFDVDNDQLIEDIKALVEVEVKIIIHFRCQFQSKDPSFISMENS